MKRSLIILAVAVALSSGCSAFDHVNTPYEGFSRDEIPFNPYIMAGASEGDYAGTMKLDSKSAECVGVVEEVGAETPVKFNVLAAGALVSVSFEDGAEESGKLVDSKVTVVKRGENDVRMYHLEFSDAGINGAVDVFPGGESTSIDVCGKYTLAMTRASE